MTSWLENAPACCEAVASEESVLFTCSSSTFVAISCS